MSTKDRRDLMRRLVAARTRLKALGPTVVAGEPWPLSSRIGVEPEASWGPPEVLAHLGEMVPFWHGEVERLLATPRDGAPPVFGRTAEDVLRIGLIGRDRQLPARELLARIDAGLDRLVHRLEGLDITDVERRAVHATRGERSILEFVEIFLVAHLEEHVRQVGDTLVRERDRGPIDE